MVSQPATIPVIDDELRSRESIRRTLNEEQLPRI